MSEKGAVKQAAFFDIDYTLISNSSMMLYVNYMRKTGEYTFWDVLIGLFYLAQYKLNLLDMETTIEKASVRYKGMAEKHLIEVCDHWFEEQVRHYIYPEARDLIEEHRKAGHELCLLTATTIYLTGPLSRHLGITNYFCNRMAVNNGIFTGEMVKPICYGRRKLAYAREFEQEQGISLKDSYFYSDSVTDLESMAAFGHPVAVNPDPLLRREAQKRGWEIIDFKVKPPALAARRGRKDVLTLKVL